MNNQFKPTPESPIGIKAAYLIEETGEMNAALGKSLRWGFDSVNPLLLPEEQVQNGNWLLTEMQDVKYAIELMEQELHCMGFSIDE